MFTVQRRRHYRIINEESNGMARAFTKTMLMTLTIYDLIVYFYLAI